MTTLAALPARCGLGASTSRRAPTFQRGSPFKRSIRARASGSESGLAQGAATLAQAQTLLLPGPMAALDCVSCTPTLASAVLTLSGSLQNHPVVAARVAASTATATAATPSTFITAATDPTATTTTEKALSASAVDAAARSATAASFDGAHGELPASFTATSWTCPANLLVSMQLANPLPLPDRPAFAPAHGLGYVFVAAGVYFAMLVSSFLFGESYPPVGAARWTRARVGNRRPRVGAAAAAAAELKEMRLARLRRTANHDKTHKTAAKAKANRTVMMYRPLKAAQPLQLRRLRSSLQVVAMAMPNRTPSLLLQTDPPEKLRRYPAIRTRLVRPGVKVSRS